MMPVVDAVKTRPSGDCGSVLDLGQRRPLRIAVESDVLKTNVTLAFKWRSVTTSADGAVGISPWVRYTPGASLHRSRSRHPPPTPDKYFYGRPDTHRGGTFNEFLRGEQRG